MAALIIHAKNEFKGRHPPSPNHFILSGFGGQARPAPTSFVINSGRFEISICGDLG
jgi:hypothetical protein